MSLKVMCAGCSAEERERTESDVRRGLGVRATGGETWIVSVVNLQSRWSVTMDGPGIRALNFTAPPGHLVEAIQQALQAKAGAPAVAAAPVAAAPPARPAAGAAAAAIPSPLAPATPKADRPAISPASGPRRDRHECAQCHQRFVVAFEAIVGEREHLSPAACPHCWHMNRVLVGETAVDTSDYRAEKD